MCRKGVGHQRADDWAIDMSRAEWDTQLFNLNEEQNLSRGVRAHRKRDYLLLLKHQEDLEAALTDESDELETLKGIWNPGIVIGSMGMYALIRPK